MHQVAVTFTVSLTQSAIGLVDQAVEAATARCLTPETKASAGEQLVERKLGNPPSRMFWKCRLTIQETRQLQPHQQNSNMRDDELHQRAREASLKCNREYVQADEQNIRWYNHHDGIDIELY